jgi:hypothetical protein
MYHGIREVVGELNALTRRDAEIRVASGSSIAIGRPEFRWVTIPAKRRATN